MRDKRGWLKWDWSRVNGAMCLVVRLGWWQDVDALYRLVHRLRAALGDHNSVEAARVEQDLVELSRSVARRAVGEAAKAMAAADPHAADPHLEDLRDSYPD